MTPEVTRIIAELKVLKIPVSKIEKDLGFSNGSLKKESLSNDRFIELKKYYNLAIEKHGPVVQIGQMSKTGDPKIVSLPLSEVNEHLYDAVKAQSEIKDEPLRFTQPEPWIKEVRDFCNKNNCTPQDLIDKFNAKPEKTIASQLEKIKTDLQNKQPSGGYDRRKSKLGF